MTAIQNPWQILKSRGRSGTGWSENHRIVPQYQRDFVSGSVASFRNVRRASWGHRAQRTNGPKLGEALSRFFWCVVWTGRLTWVRPCRIVASTIVSMAQGAQFHNNQILRPFPAAPPGSYAEDPGPPLRGAVYSSTAAARNGCLRTISSGLKSCLRTR